MFYRLLPVFQARSAVDVDLCRPGSAHNQQILGRNGDSAKLMWFLGSGKRAEWMGFPHISC